MSCSLNTSSRDDAQGCVEIYETVVPGAMSSFADDRLEFFPGDLRSCAGVAACRLLPGTEDLKGPGAQPAQTVLHGCAASFFKHTTGDESFAVEESECSAELLVTDPGGIPQWCEARDPAQSFERREDTGCVCCGEQVYDHGY